MEYSFDINVAKKYGVDEAIMIKNFQYWIMKNKASGKHFYDGRTWTYNSTKAFIDLFPFWKEYQIRRVLDSLIKQGIIIIGNYNKNAYDRTLWYAFANEEILNSICENPQMENTKNSNRIEKNSKPIPDNKPDILTDNKTNDVPAPQDADAVRLTQLFYDEIVRNRNPKVWLTNPPDLKKWQPHIEKMHTIDGLSYSEIEKIIRWVVADSFWSKNILSAETLRRQTREKDFLGRASPPVSSMTNADDAKKRLEELNARYA